MIADLTVQWHCQRCMFFLTELPWLLGQSQIAALKTFFQAIKTFGAKFSQLCSLSEGHWDW